MLTSYQTPSISIEQIEKAPDTAVNEQVREPSMLRKAMEFLALVIIAVGANYFVPKFVGTAFFIGTLVAYFRSKDEAFWLAFFLTVSDGFFSFFGLYKTVISVVPGLPEVEVGMIYLILTLFKASGKPIPYQPFYTRFLQILLIYIGFLLLQGYVVGVKMEINVQFRLVKWIVPLFMLYSIPRLFTRIEQYRDVFLYLFCVAFVALGAQFFTILNGSLSPGQYMGVIKKARHIIKVKAGKTYRGLYNEGILLITYFGALFFLVYRPGKYFPSWLCFAVIISNFASVFLSATRGWVICFSVSLILSLLFVLKMSGKRMMTMGILILAFLFSAQSLPIIGIQIENAIKRLMTIGKLAEGDETAGGSLIRLSVRGPRVMKVWSESPLTGWGFSTRFMEADDFHVGNQNILMHSGIIGYALMHLFFIYFVAKLFFRSQKQPRGSPYKGTLLVFCIFFPAWFMLHSSSQQFFSFYQFVIGGIIQAIFFSMAALMYYESEEYQ